MSTSERHPHPGTEEAAPPGVLRRAIAASAIGNATEWFDYGIYAYGVTYISTAIFPGDTQEATLFALATFAISFLVRPFGGFFWGPLGDTLGRKQILALTILMMSGCTFLIGLVPSYDTIGIWAPVLLIALRMLQGFSTGGEYGGAATFMAEYAPDDKRGLCGSFLEFGTLGGFSAGALLMLGFSLLLGTEAMHDWGWRLPFLVAAPLGFIGLYLRSKMEDTPVFEEIEEQGEQEKNVLAELRDLISEYWPILLTMGGMVTALNVVHYTLLSYMPTYLGKELGLSTDEALLVPILGMLFMMVFLPFFGHLSDKIGRKPLWWFSLIGLFVAVIPLYQLMATTLIGAIVGFAVLGILFVPQLSTISATFPAMFPTQVRFAGFAISYNVATSLFGGTAPAVNEWLIDETGNFLVPAYLMMGACAVGAFSLLFLVETAGQSLRGTEIPGTDASKREVRSMDRDEAAGSAEATT
ncbi:Proline/betaine transporter [Methyloligella halotolerans]|uniref:Proline/betaine transporter n=1 Tax=Methyloligella halotolerans TaxID=1177755 RepID=A0A1E2RVX5_9HYPH|nr:MFS transporter [Methyloligella halotolerans]ODA66312.1 Proline/betaine transporter [Methyloligella halotolerans]